MIDFSTVKGITVPEGVVKKIESNGVVLWERISDTVILQVEKITSDTYANSTTYTGEQFILLDIYPKTNGTVNVTYGGLTKTITDTSGAAEPSAQRVFFGTFNGVSDEVATPASGTLKISGDYRSFGVASFSKSKTGTTFCGCITGIRDFGTAEIIPDRAFYGCTSLESVHIPSSVTTIETYAFRNCTSLESVHIPSSVTTIEEGTFYDCTSLASIDIPNSVTMICRYAFYGCTSLTSVHIPSSATTIDGNVFQNCTNLVNINIPDGVTIINGHLFDGCTSLASIDIPNSVTMIDSHAFYNCTSLSSVPLHDALNAINGYAFYGCTSLASIDIPNGVQTIYQYTFYGCTSLSSIHIPNSVTGILDNAFEGCTSLASIDIPNSVTRIDINAFYLDIGNTRTVNVLCTTPPTLEDDTVFDVVGTNHIIVPAGCGAAYKTAEYWSEYADYITEASA